MSAEGEQSAFFAGSDDEDMVQPHEEANSTLVAEFAEAGNASYRPSPPAQSHQPLFFADSDEEEATSYKPRIVTPAPGGKDENDAESDIEIPEFVEVPRASSVSSASSGLLGSRHSSPPSEILEVAAADGPPPKRRKLSPPPGTLAMETDSMYLGSFIVQKAWSTVKGTGYIKPGEEIRIEREEDDKPPPTKKPVKDKGKGGKKQLTIANMLRPAPAKPARKKQDSVVRITNSRGFGKHYCTSLQQSFHMICRIRSVATGRCILGLASSGLG